MPRIRVLFNASWFILNVCGSFCGSFCGSVCGSKRGNRLDVGVAVPEHKFVGFDGFTKEDQAESSSSDADTHGANNFRNPCEAMKPTKMRQEQQRRGSYFCCFGSARSDLLSRLFRLSWFCWLGSFGRWLEYR